MSTAPPKRAGTANRGWAWLLLSALFEITFALSTEAAHGFTRLSPSLLTVAALTGSVLTLSQALKSIDVGVGYTVWSGIGGVGTVVFGVLVYDEPLTGWKVLAFVLILGGAATLQISDRRTARREAARRDPDSRQPAA
ncbi:DMT family transporter [Streptomyces hygroscopicus]|uniref:DMT family transporter n=1 Tax=Streptomyces hygroscopicus TaxID=1912 RepID=UPI00068D5955|nr:multidrug efflux SMR transporter [Streptomyces hygroscopicus]